MSLLQAALNRSLPVFVDALDPTDLDHLDLASLQACLERTAEAQALRPTEAPKTKRWFLRKAGAR